MHGCALITCVTAYTPTLQPPPSPQAMHPAKPLTHTATRPQSTPANAPRQCACCWESQRVATGGGHGSRACMCGGAYA